MGLIAKDERVNFNGKVPSTLTRTDLPSIGALASSLVQYTIIFEVTDLYRRWFC